MRDIDNKENRIKDILIRRILDELHAHLKEKNDIVESYIQIPKLSMTIIPNIAYEINNEEESIVYIYYRICSERLEEPIFLTSPGNGKNLEQAIKRSVFVFLSTTMEVLLEVFHCNYPHLQKETLNVEMEKKKYLFDVYISNLIEYTEKGITGKVYNEEMWNGIKEELREYLGKKKLYWIGLYGAKLYENMTIGEVSINNISCKNLNEKIEEVMRKKEKMDTKYFGMLQQYQQCICVMRKMKQYEPYPYTKEEIRTIVEETFLLLKQEKERKEGKEEIWTEYYKILMEKYGDKMLVTELLAFLPEICAQVKYIELDFSEKIGILKSGEQDVIFVYKTKITPYFWLEEKVAELYLSNQLDQSVFEHFVAMSDTKKKMEERKTEGQELELDTKIGASIVPVDREYMLR